MLRGTTSTTKACQGERLKVEIFLSGFANDAGTVAGEGKPMRRLHWLWSYASLICAHLVIGHCVTLFLIIKTVVLTKTAPEQSITKCQFIAFCGI